MDSKTWTFMQLITKEDYDFFDIASCITYDDKMYYELHKLNVKIGDIVLITYLSGEKDLIEIRDIEYGDGTIWVNLLK